MANIAIYKHKSERKVMLLAILGGILVICSTIFDVYDRVYQTAASTDVLDAQILFNAAAFLVLIWAAPFALRAMKERRDWLLRSDKARLRIETLFGMGEMLQSALGYEDANAVLRSAAARMLPGLGGALYIFNNSGDRLELSTKWNWPDTIALMDMVHPSQCWAIKTGKPHLNTTLIDALHCDHHDQGAWIYEIPMIARGELLGLLKFETEETDAEEHFNDLKPICAALAEAMSLALSNLSLRDKLRTQALRDPLTGLYNRRYMDDALARYASLTKRNHCPLSLLMVDLDHFKRVNDEHGHAVGDAVLTEVAAATIGTMRPSDIACRYGGEEIAIILPDCNGVDAAAKAELLRDRIERLSDNHGFQISASIGVATLLETSMNVVDVVTHSDAALYRAKSEGRNRVVSAPAINLRTPKRPSTHTLSHAGGNGSLPLAS